MDKHNILIVEDNQILVMGLTSKLKSFGYNVSNNAKSGIEAIKMAESLKPDLILMDIILEDEMDGIEAAQKIKQKFDIPIIFTTSCYDDETIERASIIKPIGYIIKPYDYNQLKITLEMAFKNIQINNRLKDEINKHKETESELMKAKKIAEFASEAKNEFIANMSHELRTPLNAIMGYCQLFQNDSNLSDKQKEGLEVVNKSSQHLLNLINDILEISKIEAGKMELVNGEFNLKLLLSNIVDILELKAREKDISFNYNFSDNIPDGVIGDEKRLKQILLNICGNAVKFTQKGEVNFSVKRKDNDICFQIQDTGIGIPETKYNEIFLPFQQVQDNKSFVEGTGLGLSISKKLVNMMGSNIHLKSQLNTGSTFWFCINLPEKKVQKATISKMKQQIIGFKGDPKTIIVADDNDTNRILLDQLLSRIGFQIKLAKNGLEAFELAKEIKPDVIFMDLLMPVMNGFEAVKKIRQIDSCKNTLIIALSANVFDATIEKSYEAGCDSFIPKPFNKELIFELLSNKLNIVWVYKNDFENDLKNEKIIDVPNKKDLSELSKLAEYGDFTGIKQKLKNLSTENEKYLSFIKKINTFIKEFEFDKIVNFIKSLLSTIKELS